MFNPSDRELASILETTELNIFSDPESNAAMHRVNKVIARQMRLGDKAKELPLTEQIFFVTDCILVGEGMVDMLQNNDDARQTVVAIGGAELLGRAIVQRQCELNDARRMLVELKKQLIAR